MATITTLVVFLPLVFTIEDPMMRVFLMAMTRPLSLSLLFSLLVALVFLPVMANLVDRPRPAWTRGPIALLGTIASWPVLPLAWAIAPGADSGAPSCWPCTTPAFARLVGPFAPCSPSRCSSPSGGAREAQHPRSSRTATSQKALGLSRSGTDLPRALHHPRHRRFAGPWVPFGHRRAAARLETRGPPDAPGRSVLGWIQSGNQALLRWTLEHRRAASIVSVLCLATVAIPFGGISKAAFGQEEDLSEIEIRVELEPSFTLAMSSRELRKYEERSLAGRKEELGFEHFSARFRANRGRIGLHYKPGEKSRSETGAAPAARERSAALPRHELLQQNMGDATRQQVAFELRGSNSKELERLGAQAVAILKTLPGLTDVESPLEESPEQVRLLLDREAGFAFGATSQVTLQNVSWALRGAALARYQEEGREVPMYIEYDQEELAVSIRCATSTSDRQRPVALATLRPGRVPARQPRDLALQRADDVHDQRAPDGPEPQGGGAGGRLRRARSPRPAARLFAGRDTSAFAKRDEEIGQMNQALFLSVALVLIVMGILFESLMLPFAIMTTIPFAALGGFWTLYLFHPSMDSMGHIGFILLVGVVVNNGIVLLDKIHRLQVEDGLPRAEAVIEGNRARVRPILMTAMTTVFGLLLITVSPYDGKGIDYRTLATCVAGGLTVSTFFTLWVVPLAYTLLDDLRSAGLRTMRQAFGRVVSAGAAPANRFRKPGKRAVAPFFPRWAPPGAPGPNLDTPRSLDCCSGHGCTHRILPCLKLPAYGLQAGGCPAPRSRVSK
ncbi:MAG: efflux RND transporter permease subunit [Planctomycetota bacterium]